MSHVVAGPTPIPCEDLPQLIKAAARCGLTFRQDQTTFKWYGRWVKDYHADAAAYKAGVDPGSYGKCEHAFAVKGNDHAYELGLVRDPNKPGQYLLVYDFWGSQGAALEAKVGAKAHTLIQTFNEERVLAKAGVSNHTLAETVPLANGGLMLEFDVPEPEQVLPLGGQ